jgi:methionine synthase reductase
MSYRIDLTSPPRKLTLISLAKCCKDERDSIFIEWLCSKGDVGKRLWNQFIEEQRIGISEFLTLVPSCCPSLLAFLDVVSPMPPRYYSIASSPSVRTHSLTFAFSVVRYECRVSEPCHLDPNLFAPKVRRCGMCTSFLESTLAPWLKRRDFSSSASSSACPPPSIRIFHKPTITFRLPSSIASPLILIGPGTGVAPFIGFLEHRCYLERERLNAGDDISTGVWRGGLELACSDLPPECNVIDSFINAQPPGPVLLFYGCRNEDDFLFRKQIESFITDRTITKFDVAMSRIGPEKVYVTNKLREHAVEIARLIMHEGAYVYICGDGNRMAKDVCAAVTEILVEHGGATYEQANEILNEMRLRRRYVLDVWS